MQKTNQVYCRTAKIEESREGGSQDTYVYHCRIHMFIIIVYYFTTVIKC